MISVPIHPIVITNMAISTLRSGGAPQEEQPAAPEGDMDDVEKAQYQ